VSDKEVPVTPFKIMALGILGAVVGMVICFWGTLSSPASLAFMLTPEFIVWFFVNEALFAFYPIVWVVALGPLHKLKIRPPKRLFSIIGSSVLLFGLFMFLPMVGARIIDMQPLPFVYAEQKVSILVGIGFFAAALPVSVCIWLTQAEIASRNWNTASENEITAHIALRMQLQRFVTILGALLSLFILASAALRGAAIATSATTEAAYPSVLLLLLGGYYTALAGVIYFPAHQTSIMAGKRLLDACFPLPSPSSSGWSAAYANRKDLEELLELKITGEQRFLTSITLLAPFFSSIFSLVVGK
jgi:hypothetical protein